MKLTWVSHRNPFLLLVIFFIVIGVGPQKGEAHPQGSGIALDLSQPKYRSLLKELQVKHGFDRKELEAIFKKAKFQPEIPKKFAKPTERFSYDKYQTLFIKPEIVQRGKQYLKRHRALFQKVEKAYEVDAHIIAAILGVETKFGQQTHGGYLVFDALNSTFTGVPNRESFARRELIEFIILCREEKLDPFVVKGSYAGAMGIPQFIPSSYRNFTVDFDQDGKRDLWSSNEDIFASVANYLKIHGWKQGAPVKLPMKGDFQKPAVRKLLQKGVKATISYQDLQKMGVEVEAGLRDIDGQIEVSLLAYPSKNGEEKSLLFPNFRTILTYNHAVNYALVVSDLADLLREDLN